MSLLDKILSPRLPTAALSVDGQEATVVQVERSRGQFGLRKAASVPLPAGLVTPDFTEPNIADPDQLCELLANVSESAGLGRQRKWSVALPEACAATHILTLEQKPANNREAEEVLRWKIERTFGAPYEALRVARESLPVDGAGRARYLVVGIRATVLDEYEDVFAALGWKTGFVVPRHIGEARWLQRKGAGSDALLVSAHPEGFTALVQRQGQPFILRSVPCEPSDRDDELYRLLLFYRDRAGSAVEETGPPLSHLVVIGDGQDRQHITQIVNDTLALNLNSLTPQEIGLNLPDKQFSFASVAAPAGLAALAW